MWLVARLGMCVLMLKSLSAVPTVAVAAVRMARRSVTPGVIAKMVMTFKADMVIGMEEAAGPRDPFLLFQTPLTSEQHAFDAFLAQRRLEHGLSPFAPKR